MTFLQTELSQDVEEEDYSLPTLVKEQHPRAVRTLAKEQCRAQAPGAEESPEANQIYLEDVPDQEVTRDQTWR